MPAITRAAQEISFETTYITMKSLQDAEALCEGCNEFISQQRGEA